MGINLKDIIETVCDSKEKDYVVEKTYPMKHEWRKLFEDCEEIAHDCSDSLEALMKKVEKLDTKRKLMWATIEDSLKVYGKKMRYNEETDEIEELIERESK